MASNRRRRMQNGVSVFRNAEAGLSQRRPPEFLLLSTAEAIVAASDDLSADLVITSDENAAWVEQTIRSAIEETMGRGMRVDATGLEAIGDPVSRLICQRQVPVAEQVHLMASILRGVEHGLRDVVLGYAAKARAAEEAARATRDPAGKGHQTGKAATPNTLPPVALADPPEPAAASVFAAAPETDAQTLPFASRVEGAGPSSPVRADSPDL